MLEPEKVSSSRWMGYPMQSPHPCNKLRKEESFNWAISSGNSCRPSVNRWARPSPSSAVLHALLLKEQAVDDRMNAMGSELPIWITTDIYKAEARITPFRSKEISHETLLCRQDIWYMESANSFSIPKHVGKWASLHIQRSNSELEAVLQNMRCKWAYQSIG